jgi:hypothetical protein
MSKKNYTVLSPIRHDGKDYEIGGTIGMDNEQASTLVEIGVLSYMGGFAPVEKSAGAPTDPEERLTAIKAAIGTLDSNNLDLWLKDGRPSGEAVAAVTGWPVAAAERNTAWAALQG